MFLNNRNAASSVAKRNSTSKLMKRKRNNVAVVSGGPNNWAVNNSVKNRAFKYVKNVLAEPTMQEFNSHLQNRGRNYAAFGTRGKLKGFAVLGPNRPSGTTRLYLVGTKPGRGIGGALLHQIEENARQRGVRKIRIMDPVLNALGFYHGLGYGPASHGTLTKRLSTRRSPSRPSPKQPSSSSASSARRSVSGRTPRR